MSLTLTRLLNKLRRDSTGTRTVINYGFQKKKITCTNLYTEMLSIYCTSYTPAYPLQHIKYAPEPENLRLIEINESTFIIKQLSS